jgi:hypothetical protein
VSDTERELLALRVITVSAHTALAKTASDEDAERIRDRADELLAELEGIVIRDGGDERLLDAIDAERRRIYE